MAAEADAGGNHDTKLHIVRSGNLYAIGFRSGSRTKDIPFGG
jgi:hypothetical protein